ncbi:MAG: hypothetical protein KIC77_06170 [Clostridiales bacterium]|jgi:hypothetical protein|nr:hypothetical protein [Clostridiales bacterium]
MFAITNQCTKVPIKIWLPDETHMEESCMEQALHLTNLPFIHKWVSIMLDTCWNGNADRRCEGIVQIDIDGTISSDTMKR